MDKRQDILNAAERLFYANGFHATSTDVLCREAGVSTRTFYRYFPSRDHLTEAVMDARQQRFFADLLPPDNPHAIPHLFAVLAHWMQAQGAEGCFFLKVWGEYAQQDARLSAHALDFRYGLRRYLSACIPVAAARDAVWMLFEGAITAGLIVGPDAAHQAAATAALVLRHTGEAHEK